MYVVSCSSIDVYVCVCVCLHCSVGKRCCSTRRSTHIIKCAIFNYLTLLFNYYCPMHRASQCYKAWDEGERVPLYQEPSAKQKPSVQVQQQPLLCTRPSPACYRLVTSLWLASDWCVTLENLIKNLGTCSLSMWSACDRCVTSTWHKY